MNPTKDAVRRRELLINTPLQRGDVVPHRPRNRFNGFPVERETAEAVSRVFAPPNTPLKRGVNEIGSALARSPGQVFADPPC
jgi:hypothetical protein